MLSIVTPSYNQAAFIPATIDSVLVQQYPAFEHIIIDGGSTDGTLSVLEKHPHLKWVSEKDKGQTDALNKGIRRAAGDIIGWINSDDVYAPGVFARVARLFEQRPGLVFVYGDVDYVDEAGVPFDRFHGGALSARAIAERNVLPQPGCFFRRSVFDEVGLFDESFHYAMDFEFWVRLAIHYRPDQFHHEPAVLAQFRVHGASKTGASLNEDQRARFVREERRAYEKHAGWQALLQDPSPARLAFARDVALWRAQYRLTWGRWAQQGPAQVRYPLYAARRVLERLGYTRWEVVEERRRAA
jgi:glycosyltransferase involved in cell wall biosynthesis